MPKLHRRFEGKYDQLEIANNWLFSRESRRDAGRSVFVGRVSSRMLDQFNYYRNINRNHCGEFVRHRIRVNEHSGRSAIT